VRKIALAVLIVAYSFVLLPLVASAHTGLKSSNPVDGTTVKEELKEIRLTFHDHIEPVSSLEIKDDKGTEYKFSDIQVVKTELVGNLQEPLPNGSYEVAWKIIAKDGHPARGSFTFQVDALVTAIETPAEPSTSESPSPTMAPESPTPTIPDNTTSTSTGSNMTLLIFIPVGLLFIVMLVSILKKRNK
jgi:copper resistance protein C